MEHLKGVSHLAGSVIAFFLAPPPRDTCVPTMTAYMVFRAHNTLH